MLLAPASSRAQEEFVKVIPPGNEALVAAMLGSGADLPGKCSLGGAAIDRTKIVATYACDGRKATIELVSPSSREAGAAAARTAQFALIARDDPPKALVDDVAARVAAREKDWRWVSAEAAGLGVVAVTPTPPVVASPALTPAQSEAFLAGVQLFRQGKMAEAFERFRDLARTAPENGVLGMVVASLASSDLDPATVDRLAAEADRDPSDTLAQFVAGVAAHYYGHRHGRTREEKASYYRRAITYLARTRPKFDFEPRVFVYLGVSHFRLGDQKEAEALIEQAIPLAKNDPDVYYCRGEIFQRTNLPRSIEDIKTYLTMSAALEGQGVPQNAAKRARVERMLAHLVAVSRGEAQPEDLFDPLPDAGGLPGPAPASRIFASPRTFGAAALGAAALSGLLWALFARRRRGEGA
jgi:tetratricopeptide (TPR) repeat protein